MSLFWQNLAKIILIASLVVGCAGIPGGKVNLNNYPKTPIQHDLKLSYKSEPSDKKSEYDQEFNSKLVEKLKTSYPEVKELKKDEENRCLVRINADYRTALPDICLINYFIAGVTLFTIPYYCQHIYEVKATLISYPSDASLKGKAININPNQINFSSNKIQIKQGKKGGYIITEDKKKIYEGDYFLDENSRLAYLLKTYELKDKVHEVWSLLMILGELALAPTGALANSTISTPEAAKAKTESNISEALTRSILNDASSFEECKKDQPSSPRKK